MYKLTWHPRISALNAHQDILSQSVSAESFSQHQSFRRY